MHIKTTVLNHSDATRHLSEWLELNRQITPRLGKNMEGLTCGNTKWSNYFGKTVWPFF